MKLSTIQLLLLAGIGASANADTLYLQDFETASGYTTSISEFDSGSSHFLRTSGTGSVAYTNATGSYFSGLHDGSNVSLTTDSIDISNAANLQFSVDIAINANRLSWDDNGRVQFEYQLDGGVWTSIFVAQVGDEIDDGSHTGESNHSSHDGDNDSDNDTPQINTVALSGTFSTFAADLSSIAGSTLQLRVSWNQLGSHESLAIDNISLDGNTIVVVPLPTAAFAGLGLLGGMGVIRRIRR